MKLSDRRYYRHVWPTQIGSFLVSTGLLTGLANMAFFPSAICAQGLAGNFIAVYLICVVFVGFPVTYLHLSLGQYSGYNPMEVFAKLCPAFRGIGWSWLILTIPILIISNMNSAWSLYYSYVSLKSVFSGTPLPWSNQDKYFLPTREVTGPLLEFFQMAEQEAAENSTEIPIGLRDSVRVWPVTPNYFHHLYHTERPEMVVSVDSSMILRIVDKKIVLGTLQTKMVVFLGISWLIVSICTINTVNTMNRIVYVTATLPLIILFILFTRVIYLPGAWDGIQLLYPTVQRITETSVWQSAMKLIFFDLQIGTGVLISISKHNRFHNNIFRDSILLVVVNLIVNLFCASVAFGFLGFLAYKLNVDDIRSMCRGQTGPHLLWDQILRSMAYLNKSEGPIFCFLYQFMISLGAIECSFTMCEYFASAFDHKIPWLKKNYSCVLRGFVSLTMFALTLPCCFQSGVHIYNLLVHYSMHWNTKLIALCQFLVIVYFYGVENLLADIRIMLRLPSEESVESIWRFIGPTGHFVRHTLSWICPLFILFALVLDIFAKDTTQSRRVGDSHWWQATTIVSTFPLLSFVYYIYTKNKSAFQSKKWANLKIPIDESTICNEALAQSSELELIRIDRTSAQNTQSTYDEPQTYSAVKFVINNSPYFTVPAASNCYLKSSPYESPQTGENVSNNETENPEEESSSSSGNESADENLERPIVNSRFSTYTDLTGQPSFF